VSGRRTQIKPLDNDVGRQLLIGTVSDASKGGRLVLAANKRTVTYLSAAGKGNMHAAIWLAMGANIPESLEQT
jgi:hypothetical protein